jgi:catechol 2,3-dioxygenase-like lactoylglutathione lyase family enzyme
LFRIISADHTGITVSNLERSLAFWRNALGFELSHTAHQTGDLAKEITGIAGAEIKLAVLRTPGGHKIELLEYLAPPDPHHNRINTKIFFFVRPFGPDRPMAGFTPPPGSVPASIFR